MTKTVTAIFVLSLIAACGDDGSTSGIAQEEAVDALVATYCDRVFSCAGTQTVMSDDLCDGGGTVGLSLDDSADCQAYMNGTDCVIDIRLFVDSISSYDGDAMTRCIEDVAAVACTATNSDGVWEEGGIIDTSSNCSTALARP